MKYAVLRVETSRPSGRYTRPLVSWQVVDVDAGLNERNYPKRIVASCAEEAAAEQICNHLNGVNPHAEHWKAEAELAQRELTDMENRWQGTLDFANAQAGQWRSTAGKLSQACAEQHDEIAALKRERGLYHLASDMLRDQLAEMTADRNATRNQLFETREQRDEARELAEHIRRQFDAAGDKLIAIRKVLES